MSQILALLAALMSGVLGATTEQHAADPPISPAAEAEPAPPARTFSDVSELLGALEEADRGIRTFSSQIRYTRLFEVQNDIQQRGGMLYFRTDPPATDQPGQPRPQRRRWVTVRFDELIAGGRRDRQEQLFVFDGEWLVEKDAAQKQFTKRRMARPGQVFDPLRVGEGPFFVPIGQRREDMELFFTAAIRPPEDGLSDEFDPQRDRLFKALAARLQGCIQLELIPRPNLEQVENFTLIRIWYDPVTLLPRASLAVDRLGDVDVFELFRIDVNEEKSLLPSGVFSVEAPGLDEGYHIEIIDETTG